MTVGECISKFLATDARSHTQSTVCHTEPLSVSAPKPARTRGGSAASGDAENCYRRRRRTHSSRVLLSCNTINKSFVLDVGLLMTQFCVCLVRYYLVSIFASV